MGVAGGGGGGADAWVPVATYSATTQPVSPPPVFTFRQRRPSAPVSSTPINVTSSPSVSTFTSVLAVLACVRRFAPVPPVLPIRPLLVEAGMLADGSAAWV